MAVYFSSESNNCLFCLKKCSKENNPKIDSCERDDKPHDEISTQLKDDCSCYAGPITFLGSSVEQWEDEKKFKEQVKYAFLLRELLEFPKRRCVKYLKQRRQVVCQSQDTGEADGWFSVCQECSSMVEEGHLIYHEIEKFKKKLDLLKRKLIAILTKENEEGAKATKEVEDDPAGIFTEVREYFAERKLLTGGTAVKSEAAVSAESYENDELPDDDDLAHGNFDDGSDWAPSDAEEEINEAPDVKPVIHDLQTGGKTVNEESSKSGQNPSNDEVKRNEKDQRIEKPCPKSIKFARSLRNGKKITDDQFEAMETTDQGSKRSKKKYESYSDSESESVQSDDSFSSKDSESDSKRKSASFSNKNQTCKVCGAVYTKKNRLKEHELLHLSEDSFKCTFCPYVSATARGLSMHHGKVHEKKVRHSEGKSKPEKTSSTAETPPPTSPTNVTSKTQRAGDYECTYCPVVYQTAHRLKEHLEHHLNMTNDMIKCGQCNYICLCERGMKIHVTKYHKNGGPPSKRAKRQDKLDDDEAGVDLDMSQSEESSVWHCNICTAIYKTRARLREHKKLHMDKSAPTCAECKYVCNTRKGLIMHMHEVHGSKPVRIRVKRKSKKPKIYKSEPKQCSECPAKYYTHLRFQAHVQLHSSSVNFPCEHCGWVFSSSDKRDYHMKISHGRKDIKIQFKGKTYQCNHCTIEPFQIRYKFREHLLLNHKDKVFQCSSCDLVYESQQLYDLHITKCALKKSLSEDEEDEEEEDTKKRKLFSCVQCKSKFTKQDMLNRHFALKHSTEQYPCTACTSVFPTESRLRYHMARQHDKIQNICQVCGYKSHGASHLRLHMQKHTKERLFACEICGKTFVSPTYLTAHKQKEHYTELGLEPLKCEECDVLFPTKSILKYHKQKVHEKKFKFFCELCGKGFLFASGLKNHSIIHSTDRTEVCQLCGAAYVHNRVLMEHIKHHHPEEFAEMKGLDPEIVKASTIVSQGPFICKICHIELTSRWSLHQHQKSHTEVYDRFKCGICGKGYSSPAGVKRHEETAHAAAIHACQNCGKTFPCKDYLRYHLKNHCNKKGPVKVEPDIVPTTSKMIKHSSTDIKIGDPHIVKEAGQLCIVTPNVASASSSSTSQGQVLFQGGAAEDSSRASSPSSSLVGYSQSQSATEAGGEEAMTTFYRSYMTQQQQGFTSK